MNNSILYTTGEKNSRRRAGGRASLAGIWSLLLELYDRWREHRHDKRMTEEEKEKTGGHRSF